MNEEENIITLYDEENNPVDFEHLDTFELDDSVYIVLLEILDDGRENDEVVIFRLEADDDGEDLLTVIEDDAELDAAFAEFERRIEDLEESEE